MTNLSGAVTGTYEYDAFGNEVSYTGTTPNNYLYRGEQWDPDLGLYYLRARYMNPLTGRFLSRDPKPGHIEIPRSLHKYLYASDDPVNRIDPRGKEDLVEEGEEDEIPVAAEPGERALAARINCILDTAAGALNALSALESGDYLGGGVGAISLAVDWETCSGEASGKGGKCCFAAGTPVHTNHGDVPVEKIEVGDEVESRNRDNGRLESKPVTALTPLHKDRLLELRIEGERTPLRPSIDHPFWVKRGDAQDGEWMLAGEMRTGDLVQSIQGNWRRVVSITPLPGQETVYNFTVDQDHDYFVGETGFLVHNACGCHNHHIVPRNDRRGRRAREILELAGIGINDAANMVLLPSGFHQRLHTNRYYQRVTEILEDTLEQEGPEGIACALGDIGSTLAGGTGVP